MSYTEVRPVGYWLRGSWYLNKFNVAKRRILLEAGRTGDAGNQSRRGGGRHLDEAVYYKVRSSIWGQGYIS